MSVWGSETFIIRNKSRDFAASQKWFESKGDRQWHEFRMTPSGEFLATYVVQDRNSGQNLAMTIDAPQDYQLMKMSRVEIFNYVADLLENATRNVEIQWGAYWKSNLWC